MSMRVRCAAGGLAAAVLLLSAGAAAAQVGGVFANVDTLAPPAPSLFRVPPLSLGPPVLPRVNAAAAPPFDSGSVRLAVGETLLANFIPWVFGELVAQYKDITRISPSTWKKNITNGFEWDDNAFRVNMAQHPYQGSAYFSAGRSNGFNFWWSYVFALGGSLAWECCGESHYPSKSDVLTTSLGGAAVGEAFYRLGSKLLLKRGSVCCWARFGLGLAATVMTIPRSFSSWVLDRSPLFPSDSISPPMGAYLAAGGGASWSAGSPIYAAFAEAHFTYNDLSKIERHDPPFSIFEAAIQWNTAAQTKVIGRFQIRGILGTWKVRNESKSAGDPRDAGYYLLPFLGLDYFNHATYEFGGPSVGLTAAYRRGTPQTPGIAVSGSIYGIFAGVQSEYAGESIPHDIVPSERTREYDFGAGPGGEVAVTFRLLSGLRMGGFARENHIWVMHGSNAAGPASHDIMIFGTSVRYRPTRIRLGFGADMKWYRRSSHFPAAYAPVGLKKVPELRLFLSWDALDHPLGLFVF